MVSPSWQEPLFWSCTTKFVRNLDLGRWQLWADCNGFQKRCFCCLAAKKNSCFLDKLFAHTVSDSSPRGTPLKICNEFKSILWKWNVLTNFVSVLPGFSRLNFMHLGVGIVGASGFFERGCDRQLTDEWDLCEISGVWNLESSFASMWWRNTSWGEWMRGADHKFLGHAKFNGCNSGNTKFWYGWSSGYPQLILYPAVKKEKKPMA